MSQPPFDDCRGCDRCHDCLGQYVCHCLRVKEEDLARAVVRFGLTTLDEVRAHTGAGDGCTACHRRVRQYLAEISQPSPSSSPSFSLR